MPRALVQKINEAPVVIFCEPALYTRNRKLKLKLAHQNKREEPERKATKDRLGPAKGGYRYRYRFVSMECEKMHISELI